MSNQHNRVKLPNHLATYILDKKRHIVDHVQTGPTLIVRRQRMNSRINPAFFSPIYDDAPEVTIETIEYQLVCDYNIATGERSDYRYVVGKKDKAAKRRSQS